MTIDTLNRSDFSQLLSPLFDTREGILAVLDKANWRRGRFDPFVGSGASEWWEHIYAEISKGAFDNVSINDILKAASDIYPGNINLKYWKTAESLPENREDVTSFVIKMEGNVTAEEFFKTMDIVRMIQSQTSAKIILNIAMKGSCYFHLSLEGNDQEKFTEITERLRNMLTQNGIAAEVEREPYTFRDYFADPITVEGPDGQRFALEHIRASTPVGDVARSVMNDYQGEFANAASGQGGRQQAVVDLMGEDGNGQRLDPRLTLHDAGVRPGAVLRVHPERTAGAVNPLMREEALARVRVQALDFAAAHPGFQIAANSPVAPTEYLFQFSAPGFAPPSGPGAAPRRVERHEVLVYLPPDFPLQAPEAWWQTEIFHPNIDRKSGAVCLGALQTHYKPGLDFGELCQMLVDIAAYRLYSPEPGNFLDSDASLWALSDDGQAVIEAVGGISVLGRLVFEGRPERSLRLRRLEQ